MLNKFLCLRGQGAKKDVFTEASVVGYSTKQSLQNKGLFCVVKNITQENENQFFCYAGEKQRSEKRQKKNKGKI